MRLEQSKEELIEDLVYLRGLGYTQEEIQERLDVPQQTVSRWLNKLKELDSRGDVTVAVGVTFHDE